MKERLRKKDGDILDDFSKVFEPAVVSMTSEGDCNQALERLASFYDYKCESCPWKLRRQLRR